MIYTSYGPDRGSCGHRHLTPRDALMCIDRYRDAQQARGDYSDRYVVAVKDDTPWVNGIPTTHREPNDAELEQMYSG